MQRSRGGRGGRGGAGTPRGRVTNQVKTASAVMKDSGIRSDNALLNAKPRIVNGKPTYPDLTNPDSLVITGKDQVKAFCEKLALGTMLLDSHNKTMEHLGNMNRMTPSIQEGFSNMMLKNMGSNIVRVQTYFKGGVLKHCVVLEYAASGDESVGSVSSGNSTNGATLAARKPFDPESPIFAPATVQTEKRKPVLPCVTRTVHSQNLQKYKVAYVNTLITIAQSGSNTPNCVDKFIDAAFALMSLTNNNPLYMSAICRLANSAFGLTPATSIISLLVDPRASHFVLPCTGSQLTRSEVMIIPYLLTYGFRPADARAPPFRNNITPFIGTGSVNTTGSDVNHVTVARNAEGNIGESSTLLNFLLSLKPAALKVVVSMALPPSIGPGIVAASGSIRSCYSDQSTELRQAMLSYRYIIPELSAYDPESDPIVPVPMAIRLHNNGVINGNRMVYYPPIAIGTSTNATGSFVLSADTSAGMLINSYDETIRRQNAAGGGGGEEEEEEEEEPGEPA